MKLTINANSLFVRRYLKLTDWGVVFMETAALGGKRKFSYDQIDYILLSPDHVLSFQVGSEVFSVPTKPAKRVHQQAIYQLQAMAAAAAQRSVGFPVIPAGS